MDVEQGGIVVPSFLGKSVRSSIEVAQDSGLELDVVGSGRALDQSPPPGSHVASGARITAHLVYELGRRKGRYAAGSACIGGGQGMAVILERI